MSNRTTSEYIVDGEIEPNEPPPPYSEFPTETSVNNNSDNNNNEQLTNEYVHNPPNPERPISPTPHFTQPPLPHSNLRSHFHFFNEYSEYPLPPSVPHHITAPNVPFTQFSHPNVQTPLLPVTYYPMHSPMNETHPFLPPHSSSRRSSERVYSVSQRVIESEDDCCCTAPCEISTWGCLIYLALFSMPFGIFCFTWVITTSALCVALIIAIPPLGYLAFLATAASYRMLGRIELITQQLCGYPRLFRDLGYQAYPSVFSTDSPFIPIQPIQQPQGCFCSSLNSSFNYITDSYTRKCFIYFLIIKFFLSIFTFIIIILIITFSLPFILCLIVPVLYFIKTIGVWQKEVAFKWLI